LVTSYQYNPQGALKSEREQRSGILVQEYSYQYDDYNNRTRLTAAGAKSFTPDYTYDKNNRLRNESKTEGDTTYLVDYQYDPNGNLYSALHSLLTTATGSPSLKMTMSESLDGVTLYEYDGFNRQVGVKTAGTTASYSYLPNGLRKSKTVNGAATSFVWDGDQLVYETGTKPPTPMYECVIPAGGEQSEMYNLGLEYGRTYWVEVDGVITECMANDWYPSPSFSPFIWVPWLYLQAGSVEVRDEPDKGFQVSGVEGQTVRIYDSDPRNGSGSEQNTVYVRGLNLIASVENNAPSYYLYNAHGDVVQLTNSTGTVTKEYDYDAFGNEQTPSATDQNPFRYCGEYLDSEMDTYYLRARYYNPVAGRFLSEDSVRAKHINIFDSYNNYQDIQLSGGVYIDWTKGQYIVDDPLSLNLYTYTYNNPVTFKDPSGNIVLVDDAAVILVLATGAVIIVTAAWLYSPEGQKAINNGATAIHNGLVVAGRAVTSAAIAAVDSVVSGVQWVGEKVSDAWTWTTGLFLAKNKYGDKTVEEVLKGKRGSIKNAPLPPNGPNWKDLLPLTMEEVRKLAQKGETGYREIWKLLNEHRFDK
jgi:RHS repeat-associated protein